MTIADLIAILQTMPQDAAVEVNNNGGGKVYAIDCVDYFTAEESGDINVAMIQVNC